MVKIEVSGSRSDGKFILLDDGDFERYFKDYRFYIKKNGRPFASIIKNNKGGKKPRLVIARAIMNPPPHLEVDHINRDPFDNRKSNLRLCTRSQNEMNKPARTGTASRYKGIHLERTAGKWRAVIQVKRVRANIGLFINEEDAARAYNEKAKELFGEFAWLNPV